MSIIISFILPIIFFICTIPTRGSLAVLQLRLMTIRRANKHKDKLSFSKENLSELALISSITAIKLGLTIWNGVTWILTTMLSLVSSIFGLIFIILIVCVFGAYTYVSSGGTLVSNNAGGITTNVGYNYLAIDWSQDFTSKLNSIEAQYGARVRNWVELVIINMNTVQNTDVKDKFNLNFAWWSGFKSIETGISVASAIKDDEELQGVHPITHIITMGENDGPMQIIDGSQSTEARRNPIYNNCSAQRGSGGSRYYYPDCCYGSNKSYGEYFPNGISYVADCIKSVGGEATPEHIQLITNMLTANAYNGGASSVLGTGRMTGTCKNLATLFAIFFENYGWEINDKHIRLAKSMQSNVGLDVTVPITSGDMRENIICEFTGVSASSYTNAMSRTGDFGVVTPDGQKVNQPLFQYLISLAPANVQKELKEDSLNGGMGDFINAMIADPKLRASYPVYPFSVWLNAIFMTDVTIDLLGVRQQVIVKTNENQGNTNISSSGSVSEQIYKRALEAGKTGTIQTFDGKGQADRLSYQLGSDLPYETDCSRFVYRVMLSLGLDAFGYTLTGDKLKNFNVVSSGTNGEYFNPAGNMNTTTEMAWARANHPKNVYNYSDVKGKLERGDLVYHSDHVVIYMGTNSKGEEYTCEASGYESPSARVSCSTDPNNLIGGYSFGFKRFDPNNRWTTVIRLGDGWQ